MSVHAILKSKENFQRGRIRLLSGISFLLGFLDAFLLYVLSSYFLGVVDASRVSWFYLIAFGLVLLFLMRLQPLVHRLGSVRLLLLLLVSLISCSFFLTSQNPSWIGALVLVTFMVCSNMVWSVMDILVEDFSADQVSGRIRGFYLTVLNLGLLLAPWLSTQTLDTSSYPGIFLVLGLGYSLAFLIVLASLREHTTIKLQPIAFLQSMRRALGNKNITIIYFLSWMLEFFYVIMIIYAPLFLLSRGLDWQEIGVVFTIMLIPFVLIQYPLGILADKVWGEKELLILSLVIMALATGIFGSMEEGHSVLIWGVVLFATRIGAAALEVLRDAYFYKQIGPEDTDMVALFRTTRPVANIIGAFLALAFLVWFPVESLFFLVAFLATLAAFLACFLRDTDPESKPLIRA